MQTVIINKTQRKIFSTSDYYPTIKKAMDKFLGEYGNGESVDTYSVICDEGTLPEKLPPTDTMAVYFIEETR